MRYLPILLLLCLFACKNETAETNTDTQQWVQIDQNDANHLTFEKMKVYPILAQSPVFDQQSSLGQFANFREALEVDGFRLTEKKKYGTNRYEGAVNLLTVHNKSQDTIYLMTGDVVQGGKQDRILAQDMIVPPRTLTDIPVFCVEQNRWDYQAPEGEPMVDLDQRQGDHIAFNGYYNMASNDLRRTVKETNNQQEVWNKVGELTALNNATTTTGTYAALEKSDDFIQERDDYLNHFRSAMDQREDVVGIVVVSGQRVLGADVFGHSDLFKKQYEAILHGYIIDAISEGKTPEISNGSLERFEQKINRQLEQSMHSKADNDNLFRHQGRLIHFTSF